MASRYEVDLTVISAHDLKNVNWRHGDLNPYVVAWIDPAAKCSSKVAFDGDTKPVWDEKIVIPLPPNNYIEDSTLYIDVVHAGAAEGTKPLVGSARLHLREVVDEAGIGGKVVRTLKLKRPSGRPQGKLEVKVAVKEPARYYDPYAQPPPAGYGYNQSSSRDYYGGGGGYGQSYPAAAPPSGYPYAPAPPTGYSYGSSMGSPAYGAEYGTAPPVVQEKKSKFGMGTGLAVGAAAGVLGGLALAEGIDYVEDKIADDTAEKVEYDLAANQDFGDDYGGDDF